MEKLKIDYILNLEDFKAMEAIEHSYFQNENISPAEEVLKWYEKNNLTHYYCYIFMINDFIR